MTTRKPIKRKRANAVTKFYQLFAAMGPKRPRPKKIRYKEIVPC